MSPEVGLLGFGGPAAHIARMEEDEIVHHRAPISRERFLDILGAGLRRLRAPANRGGLQYGINPR